MVGPTIPVSASGEHAGFAGTLSIGLEAMTMVVVELVRSADWAAGVVLVNGHGGNHRAMTDAVATLTKEGRHALAWWPNGRSATTAARTISTWADRDVADAGDRPGLVRFELAEAGPDTTIDELRARGVRAVSPSGVLGDPNGASGAKATGSSRRSSTTSSTRSRNGDRST